MPSAVSTATPHRPSALSRWAVHRPLVTLGLAAALTLSAAAGLPHLTLRTDGGLLVPPEAPEVVHDRIVRDTFDLEAQIAVVIETDHADGVFNASTLRLVHRLSGALAAVDGIEPDTVTSLATERRRVDARWSSYLEPRPETDAELAALRDELRDLGLYTGTLIAHPATTGDERTPWRPHATAILLGLADEADAEAVHDALQAVVAREADTAARRETDRTTDPAPRHIVHVVGAPIAEALLGRHILGDLARLLPLALVLMSLVFLARYRSALAVALPLAEVGAAQCVVFGLMGHLDVPVTLPVTVLPVILTALGVADEIHLLDRLFALRRTASDAQTEHSHHQVVLDTMASLQGPVVKTSLTTALALLSFGLSPIAPVRHFGLFAAVGVLVCMAWSLTATPALLVLAGRGRPGTRNRPSRDHLERWIEGLTFALARTLARGSLAFGGVGLGLIAQLALMIGLALTIGLGVTRLQVQDSWTAGFAPESPLRRATERVDALFDGVHLLRLHFDARPGTVTGPLTVDASDPTEPRLRAVLPAPGERLDPDAFLGEELLLRLEPDLPIRTDTSFVTRRADVRATVTGVERAGDELRLELTPRVDAGMRRLLARRGDGDLPFDGWRFVAAGERLFAPQVLARLEATARRIDAELATGDGGGVLEPAEQIAVARWMIRGRHDGERRLGDHAAQNRQLLAALTQARGADRVDEMIDPARRQALLTVFLRDADFTDVGRLLEALRDHAQEHLEPAGIRLRAAGEIAVSQAMIAAVVDTQLRSLLLSLLAILLVTSLLFRSVVLGLVCTLPTALTLLVELAVLGLLGIPLGVATSMFAAMALGVGVDFAIHLVARHRRRSDLEPVARLRDTLGATGPAIVTDVLVLGLGFGVLGLSTVPANAHLGLLVAVAVVASAAVTLGLVPLLLARLASLRRIR